MPYAFVIPHTSSMSFGPTPLPMQADAAIGFEEVTNGYVPWSMSSSAPCAPSKITVASASSLSHTSRVVSWMCSDRRWP